MAVFSKANKEHNSLVNAEVKVIINENAEEDVIDGSAIKEVSV
jgi:hypothetical protein